MATTTLLDMQVPSGIPLSSEVQKVSDPLLPPQATPGLLSHFYDGIYDLRPESHLSRLLNVLLGDAGVGQLRKRLVYTQISSMLSTSHFYDIDRLFADVFGFRRFLSEGLDLDPTTQGGTMEEWEAVLAADASYRNRVEQFVKGIAWCTTPYGIEQVCSATIGYPVEIVESYQNVDVGLLDTPDIPAGQFTYGELESFTYGELESRSYSEIDPSETDPTVSPIDIGPGSSSSGAPTVFTGPALSLTPMATPGLGGTTVYYRTTPAADGTFSIDTSLSDTWVSGFWPLGQYVHVDVISGGTVLESTLVNLKQRIVVQVTSGTPLNFSVTCAGFWSLSEIHTRVLIQSGDTNINPWNSQSPLALKPSRTNFTVRPLRPITQEERAHLIRVLDRLKPVNSRAIIDLRGVPAYSSVEVNGVYTPSTYWSIRGEVIPGVGVADAYSRTGESGEAVEQPLPVFTEYQGEEWAYNGDVVSVTSYAFDESGVFQTSNYERVVDQSNHKAVDYLPTKGTASLSDVKRGKAVRDGILVTSPVKRGSL